MARGKQICFLEQL